MSLIEGWRTWVWDTRVRSSAYLYKWYHGKFFTLFSPVMFCQLISYDTLLRIQLWVRGLPWGSERSFLLMLPNDLEVNWECQSLQHVLCWRNSMTLSNALLYKLSSTPWFLQMSKPQPSGLSDFWIVGFPCSFFLTLFQEAWWCSVSPESQCALLSFGRGGMIVGGRMIWWVEKQFNL